jgi:hypothetical protein
MKYYFSSTIFQHKCRDISRISLWLYMGHTIRGGLTHKIKPCTTRLQGVLDIVIVTNRILYF